MHVSKTTRSLIVKAFRVLLVFSLVFWSTFRVEMVAFAEGEEDENPPVTDAPADNTDTKTTDDQGEDQGGDEGQSQGDGQGDGQGQGDDQSGGQGQGTEGQGQGGNQGQNQGGSQQETKPASTLKDLEIHLLNENPSADPADPLKHVGAFVYSAGAQSGQSNVPQISNVEGELKFVPVIVKTDGSKLDASGLVEWSVEARPDVADFTESGGKKTNVLKAKGKDDDEVVAVCTLKKDAYSQFNLDANATVRVEFKVSVIEQAGAYVDSIVILDKDGNPLKASDTLKLDLENGSLSYQFAAELTVRDPAPNANPATHTISTAKTSDLSDHDKALVESLVWSVADNEDASIDKTGLFKTNAKIETTVMVTTAKGHGSASVSASATVNTGLDVDVQGASHPQDTLLVIAPSEVVKGPDTAGGDTGAGEAETTDGGSSPSSADAGAAAGEAADSAATATDATAGEGAAEENAESTAPKPEPVNKAYSLDELSALGWSTATYTLQGATAGALGESENTTTITGAGPSLVAILEDAGVDFAKVRSITFVNYQGESKTIAWSAMGGEESSAMLAADSLVHADGEDAAAGGSGLLKNTRFRLLVGDNVSVESALPWVNTIRVNGDGTGSGGSGTTDSSLRAVIGYIPVAKGSTAILSASVVGLYQGEQFGYEWQESSDGGVTWSESVDTAQTLRVPTSDATIGRMYRVVATTSNGRRAESDPVAISENTGFSVALAYDPPLAGEMAFFTTSVTGVEPADITDYIWEWTENGGDTWQEIAGSRGNPTFSAKTDPVDAGGDADEEGAGTGSEGEGAGSGESADPEAEKEIDKTPAPSMWVHVRVLATGGREAVSNPVMLTVHVSEDPGTGQVPTEDIPQELPDEQSAPGSDDPVVTPTEPEEKPAPPTETGPVIQEVTSITTESAPRSQSTSHVVTSEPAATEQTPDGTQTTPTPETAASDSPTDLIVNPAVTAEILEQREAVNEAVQATHPGARWTALTTVDPDGKDIQRILSDNPFVPLTAPFALGITAAGFVEKLLGFRRQVR